MNGIDEFHIFVEIVMVEIFLQEDAQHARMPVVAVNDVGLEADARQHRQHGAAEIGEPFVVVGIAVQAVALEVPFIVDEVYLDAVHIDFVDAVVQLTPGRLTIPVVTCFICCFASSLIRLYFGMTRRTSMPLAANSFGKAPMTSLSRPS